MNKYIFLKDLNYLLQSLPNEERVKIMDEYEKHFEIKLNEGLDDIKIINDLGSPSKVASKYIKNLNIDSMTYAESKKTTSVIGLLFVIFINFLLFGPYLGIWITTIVFIALSIGSIVFGFLLLLTGIFSAPFAIMQLPSLLVQNPILVFTSSFMLISLGILVLVISYFFIKLLIFLTYKYVKWNLNIIREV